MGVHKEHLNKQKKIQFICHLHIYHNTPCLLTPFPTHYCLNFSWDDCNTLDKLTTKVIHNFGG